MGWWAGLTLQYLYKNSNNFCEKFCYDKNIRNTANLSNKLYKLQEKDSSVKDFSSCMKKKNRQCMENLLQTTGQIQGQVQS